MTNYHVLPRQHGWAVKGEGNNKATAIVANKTDAIRIANKLGNNTFVHKKNGQVQHVTYTSNQEAKTLMKTKRRVHVLPDKKHWKVMQENADQATKLFNRKFPALRHAHKMAEKQNTTLVIHDKSGQIRHVDIPPHYQSTLSDVVLMR